MVIKRLLFLKNGTDWKGCHIWGEQPAKALPFFTIKGIALPFFAIWRMFFILQIIEPNQTFFSVKTASYSRFWACLKLFVRSHLLHHWKIKPHDVRLLFFQWWNEVARLHSYERLFVKFYLRKNRKKVDNQRKMILKSCFCLAPIRVL